MEDPPKDKTGSKEALPPPDAPGTSNVTRLTTKRRTTTHRQRRRGVSLCRTNHHKWEVMTERRFDVKLGKLVTQMKCSRCAATKVELL